MELITLPELIIISCATLPLSILISYIVIRVARGKPGIDFHAQGSMEIGRPYIGKREPERMNLPPATMEIRKNGQVWYSGSYVPPEQARELLRRAHEDGRDIRLVNIARGETYEYKQGKGKK